MEGDSIHREKARRGWWYGECWGKQEESRSKIRSLRKGQLGEEKYTRIRCEYKELCNRKKEENWEKLKIEIEQASREGEVWRLIDTERKKGKR